MSRAESATLSASRVEVVALGANLPSDLVERWHTLARTLDGTSYFQTPDWILAWWDTVAERPPTSFACWSDDDGRLRALVGLSRMRYRIDRRLPISIGVIANAGSGPGDADHCGPLVDPSWRAKVADWLHEVTLGSTLLLRDTDPATSVRVTGSRLLASTPCPRLRLTDARQPLARSSNFRRQLGRFERQLHRDGVRFEWIAPGGVGPATIDRLLDLHLHRRAAGHRTSSLGMRHRLLLTALTRTATPAHGPAAAVACVGTRVVGVVVGFRWKDTFSAYQSGWDPAYSSSSLGSVLVHRAIQFAAADGMRTFDFLRGAEPYKYRFGAVDEFDHSYLLARNIPGRTLEYEHALRGGSGRSGTRERPLEQVPEPLRLGEQVEVLLDDCSRAGRTPTRELLIIEQACDRFRERGRVVRLDEHSGVPIDKLRYSRESGRHDGYSRRHRFHQRHRNAFRPSGRITDRCEHEDVGASQRRGDFVGRARAADVDPCGDAESMCELLDVGARGTVADEDQTQRGVASASTRQPPRADTGAPSSSRANRRRELRRPRGRERGDGSARHRRRSGPLRRIRSEPADA